MGISYGSMISWWWYDDIRSCGSIRNTRKTNLPAAPLYPLRWSF